MAPDDRDDYLDIELDDEADSAPSNDVLEVSFDDLSPQPGPSRPSQRLPESSASSLPPAETGLPMIAAGVCSRCGYALRPLEEICPRCQTPAGLAVEKPVEKQASVSPPAPETSLPAVESPIPSPHGGSKLFAIAGGILFVVFAVGIPLYLWMQPAQRAKREYQAGLTAQLRGDFEGAREHYRAALGFDPEMGLAAFSLGTTYLRVGDPAIVQSVEQITQKAMWGQTQELDEADRWFEQAATIGDQIPPSRCLMDQKISSPARLRAFARACLALTALIRASAAVQADQLDDAMTWFAAATRQAQTAIIDDPDNEAANQILKAAAPMNPGNGGTIP